MFWWLFWGELMHRWVEPQPPRLRHRAPAGAASSSARRRPAREPASSAGVASRSRRPALRLICVDGVRIDRAAS